MNRQDLPYDAMVDDKCNKVPKSEPLPVRSKSSGSTRRECQRCNHWPICKTELKQNLEGECPYFEPGRVSEIVGYVAELRCVLDQLYSRRRISFGDMRPPYMTKDELKSEYARGDALAEKISQMVRSIY